MPNNQPVHRQNSSDGSSGASHEVFHERPSRSFSPLLPETESNEFLDPPSSRQILRIALRLRLLIDNIVPVEFDPELIAKPDSSIITPSVVDLAREAAGGKGNGKKGTSSRRYQACLIFALLIVRGWYRKLSFGELHDSELYNAREVAAEYIAKRIIESEEDTNYLFINMLCQRYTINLNSEDSPPLNALELAVDYHSTIVIASSGYQRCMQWLWRGWIIQSDEDPLKYVMYNNLDNSRLLAHFDPDRIKTPKYQNFLQILFSFIYLIFFTLSINFPTDDGSFSVADIFYYTFSFSFILDELIKFYHVGKNYIGFWNVLNDSLYALVATSFIFKMFAIITVDSDTQDHYNEVAYRLLACSAPLMYCRFLLFLDSIRFFGAMLVVCKVMMKESIVYFVLLFIISLGFLQALLGLDSADGARDVTKLVLQVISHSIIGDNDYDAFSRFAPPYAAILYYIFVFLCSVILLNILIALFNSAYQNIYDNANDEYLALLAQNTLRYIRAPDENVFVPPLNLIEFFLLNIPLYWWLPKKTFEKICYNVMLVVYSPILVFVSISESKDARRVGYNRLCNKDDDDNEVDYEWNLDDGYEEEFSIAGHLNISSNESNVIGNLNTLRIRRELQTQQRFENIDPEFLIDEKKWEASVKDRAPKVEEGQKTGYGWEMYDLGKKLDTMEIRLEDIGLSITNTGSKSTSTENTLTSVDQNQEALKIEERLNELNTKIDDLSTLVKKFITLQIQKEHAAKIAEEVEVANYVTVSNEQLQSQSIPDHNNETSISRTQSESIKPEVAPQDTTDVHSALSLDSDTDNSNEHTTPVETHEGTTSGQTTPPVKKHKKKNKKGGKKGKK